MVAGVASAEPQSEPTLTVSGEARLQVAPDQVSLSLGVVTVAKTAKQALADNSTAMDKVIKAIIAQGLSQQDYRTRRLNVQPQWSPPPRNADSHRRPQIEAYRVSNNLEVVSQDIEQLGELILQVTAAGANTIDRIEFGLANPRQYRQQAIAQATANAREDAETAAKASGLKLEQVQTIHLDQAASSNPIESFSQARMMLQSEAAMPPPINAADLEVVARVTLVYRLAE